MANQTITTDSNHDDLTGRAAGEDITIQQGATLTIDSCPHLTAMGILGDITLTEGTLRIDGSRTFEVAYSNGSGSLPSVGDAISWSAGFGGSNTGKVIRLDSGDATSGVLTLTKDVGETTPDADDSITDGSWTADLDSVKTGFLVVFGEDQDWGSVDATSSLVITGDWYEVGVGDGTDNQTLELPHIGHQGALWVETGSGTGIFEIWFRVTDYVGTIYWNGISQFGATQESGHVYQQALGDATVTFGDGTNGGNPPNGARIRIPNVHIGTTTVGAPTTEVNSATVLAHIRMVPSNTNMNVAIDHLNGSSVVLDFIGTNKATVSDSCWGIWTAASFINKVNAPVTLTNCALVNGNNGTGDYATATASIIITDNIGGVTFDDCLVFAGANTNNTGALLLTTMANISFLGTNKIVSNQQDENTMACLRGSVALNITAETLICLGGPIYATAGCNDWSIDELVFGLPPGRGTTEQNMNVVNLTGTQNVVISSGHKADGAKVGTLGLFLLTDTNETVIRSFGSPTAKIDLENRATYVCSFAGIASNTKIQRLWFDNLNGTQGYVMLNSVADLLIENCSGEYTDEIELDANRVLAKGLHGASGAPDAATGVEGDNTNILATCFLDYFKSDTTGALGLQFNDRGQKHLTDIEIVAGTPVWNGLCDLLLRTVGDQVIYTWPYWIKGHTGFQNAAIELAGVGTANLTYEYDLDTGSGFSGSWTTVSGANLSAESISPSGFRFKLRITCVSGASTNALKGLAVRTTTTLIDQANNLYPLEAVPVSVTCRDAVSNDLVTGAMVYLEAASGGLLPSAASVSITRSSSTATVAHTTHGMTSGQVVVIRGANELAYNGAFSITVINADSYSYTVSGTPDTPATGTITATARIMQGLSVAGVYDIDDFAYTSDQPVQGRVRKGTVDPYYKSSPISGTITDAGLSITAYLVPDD